MDSNIKTFAQFTTEEKIRKMGAPRGAKIDARGVRLPEGLEDENDLPDQIARAFPQIVINTTSNRLQGTGILEDLQSSERSVVQDLSEKLSRAIGGSRNEVEIQLDWKKAKLHWEVKPQLRDPSKAMGEFRLIIPQSKTVVHFPEGPQEVSPDMPIEAKVQYFQDSPQGNWKAILVQ